MSSKPCWFDVHCDDRQSFVHSRCLGSGSVRGSWWPDWPTVAKWQRSPTTQLHFDFNTKYLLMDQLCWPLALIARLWVASQRIQNDSPFLLLAFFTLRHFWHFNFDVGQLLNQLLNNLNTIQWINKTIYLAIKEVFLNVLDNDTLFRHFIVDPVEDFVDDFLDFGVFSWLLCEHSNGLA